MHTDSSLALLQTLTTEFGRLIRQFRDLTCSAYNTVELPGETAARMRRNKPSGIVEVPAIAVGPQSTALPSNLEHSTLPSSTTTAHPTNPMASQGQDTSRRYKTLNLTIYKLHALGDYVNCIRLFGTTDSYSTQLVKFLTNKHTTTA